VSTDNKFYPSGLYGPTETTDTLGLDTNSPPSAGDDPSWVSDAVNDMSEGWAPIYCVAGGTSYLRDNAREFIPIEPKEDESAWKRRVSKATLTPFTTKIADQGAGLILRKSIQLSPKTGDGAVAEFWEEFCENVDGYGTDLDAFARSVVISSLMLGHAGVIVDYPAREPAPNLEIERERGLRPYFIKVDADQIIGWRKEAGNPISPIVQVRIKETVTEQVGQFGDRSVVQIRVLEQGSWRVFRKGENGWELYEEGQNSLSVIPLAVTYSGKISELISRPPLLSIANINICHAQRECDLNHALHVSALPILVLRGYDDSDNEIGLSANSAILMSTDSDASYVEPASSAFTAQQSYITELENQMKNLGISTLFSQTMAAETAESKQISRSDSDSLLAIVSKDLQSALQNAFDMAGEFIGQDAPVVQLDRDFDLQQLTDGQIGQYLGLYTNNVISLETLLSMLRAGEVLPSDLDIEEEIEKVEEGKLDGIKLMQQNSLPFETEEQEEEEVPPND